MLALLGLYRCLPRRFRLIARWLAMFLFIFVVALVLILFAQTLVALKRNHGHWLLHPRSHQPLSPDFILYEPHHQEMNQ
jgi:hypothetical protein